jgi:hypothetical protein
MRSVSDVERLIVFQGTGHGIIRVQGICLVREGISYIKGTVFPPFAFLHPLSFYIKLFIPLAHHPLSWPPTLKTSSVQLMRLMVPLLGIWNQSDVSSLVLPLRMQYVFFLLILLTVFS